MAYYNPAQEQQPQQIQYQVPVVYYAQPAITCQPKVTRLYGPHYHRPTSTGLGATQIVLACISIAAGVMAIVYEAAWYPAGVGIWAGALITATLVFSVFVILCSMVQLGMTSTAVSQDVYCAYYDNYYGYDCHHDWIEEAIAANSMMIAVGSLEFIIGFWLMGICARSIDVASKAQQVTVPVTFAPAQPETVFIQAPSAYQPQPQLQPPPYYIQPPYQSTSNPQQMMYVGVHQAPLTTVKF